MRPTRLFYVAALMALFTDTRGLGAAEITGQTTCLVALRAFEGGGDDERIRQVGTIIKNTFWQLDDNHTNNGEPGIMAALTDKAIGQLIGMAMVYCQQQPKLRLSAAAAQAYVGMRALQAELGGLK